MGLSLVETAPKRSDRELVAACVAGDPAAQRALFRRELDRVSAMVYRIVGSTRDCDDLVQETFIAAFRGLAKFRGEAKLSTLLDRIAIRVVFQHIKARKLTVSLDVVGEIADAAGATDARAHARDGLRRLYAALAELAPDARIAFALYAIDGRTIPEVAEITRTSQVTAKLRIWRARRKLYARLAGDPVIGELVEALR